MKFKVYKNNKKIDLIDIEEGSRWIHWNHSYFPIDKDYSDGGLIGLDGGLGRFKSDLWSETTEEIEIKETSFYKALIDHLEAKRKECEEKLDNLHRVYHQSYETLKQEKNNYWVQIEELNS